MRETLQEYCSRYDRSELLAQWHPEKNGTRTPASVSYGSQLKIWWKCEDGHEWQSPPYARVGKNTGCPYCAGKRLAVGEDLKSRYPELARQWHPIKNGQSLPEQFLPGSHKSVWWCCDRGHEWSAQIKARVEGRGCPVCANRVVVPGENDLQTCEPQLAAQWHPTKNGALTPHDVVCGTSRKIWWRCERGHEWAALLSARVKGSGCPYCTGKLVQTGENDLETCAPDVAAQWVAERNGALMPGQVSVYSNKRVWWRCRRGHEWQAAISARTFDRSGCPYCERRKLLTGFNDLQTLEPLVAAQWHPTKNGSLTPDMVMPGCRKRVWWQCVSGHEWKAVVYSRTGAQQCGCPVCSGRAPRDYR